MILSKNTKNLSIFHLTQWFQFQNPDRLIIRTVIFGTRHFKVIVFQKSKMAGQNLLIISRKSTSKWIYRGTKPILEVFWLIQALRIFKNIANWGHIWAVKILCQVPRWRRGDFRPKRLRFFGASLPPNWSREV